MIAVSQPNVLVIGVDPAKLDCAEWGVTPAANAMVQAAIARSEQSFRDAGYDVTMCLIALDADLQIALVPHIEAKTWNVVVIGGGIRHPPQLLLLFEQVVNLVHRHAPQAAIAFNATPADCLQAAERWL
jgi:hypothetical protein